MMSGRFHSSTPKENRMSWPTDYAGYEEKMSQRDYWEKRFSVADPLERVIAYMDYCYGPYQAYLDEDFESENYDACDTHKLVNYISRYLKEMHPQSSASKVRNDE